MHLQIPLAGMMATWTFTGSSAFEDWVDSEPWATGGVLVVCVPTGADLVAVALQMRDRLHGAISGRFKQRFRLVGRPAGDSVIETVLSALSFGVSASRFEQVRLIASELQTDPQTLLFHGGGWRRDNLDDLRILVSDVSKVAEGAWLTCVVFVEGIRNEWPDAIGFDCGGPIEAVMSDVESGGAWLRYLHHRLAWEAGGDFVRAQQIAGSGQFRVGDDRSLERALNAFASGFAEQEGVSWAEELASSIKGGAVTQCWAFRSDDRGIGRLPVPWVARTLLLHGELPELHQLLRQALTCTPLASEIVGRCLQIEAVLRSRFLPRRTRPPLEVEERFLRFRNGQLIQSELIPLGSPAMPEDPWELATLGEFFFTCSDPIKKTGDRLRFLRNALAHGGYATWRAVEIIHEIQRNL